MFRVKLALVAAVVVLVNVPRPIVAQDADKATVYVYRIGKFAGAALRPSVFVDDNKVADMSNGKYFALRLEPGMHVIRSNDKDSQIGQQWEAGKQYFLKIAIVTGMLKGHGQISTVPDEQARKEIAKLKPLAQDDVDKNAANVVVLDPPK